MLLNILKPKNTNNTHSAIPKKHPLDDEFSDILIKHSDIAELLKQKIVKTFIMQQTCVLFEFTDNSALIYYGKNISYTGKTAHIRYDKILIAFTSNKNHMEIYFENSQTFSAICTNGVYRYFKPKKESDDICSTSKQQTNKI